MPQIHDSDKKDPADLKQTTKSKTPLIKNTPEFGTELFSKVDNNYAPNLMSNENENKDENKDENENENISPEVEENIKWIKKANSYKETLLKKRQNALDTKLDKYLNSSEPDHFSKISPSKDFFNNLLNIENFLRKAYISSSDYNTSSKNKFIKSKLLKPFQKNPMDIFKKEISEFISTHKNDETFFKNTESDSLSIDKLKYDYMIDFETIIKRTLNEITKHTDDELSDIDKKSVIILTSFLRPKEDERINVYAIKELAEEQEINIIIKNKLQKNSKIQEIKLIQTRLTKKFKETLEKYPEYSSKKKYSTLNDSDFIIDEQNTDNLNNYTDKTNKEEKIKELWELGRALARCFGILVYGNEKYKGYYSDTSKIYEPFDNMFKIGASKNSQKNFLVIFQNPFCEDLATSIDETNILGNDTNQFKEIIYNLKKECSKFTLTSSYRSFIDNLYETCKKKLPQNIQTTDFLKDGDFFSNLKINTQ